RNGRVVERHEYADDIDVNRERILASDQLYKRRQSIVEHPFGTIKRQWGFDHVVTKKGMNKAEADVGLIFIAYNFRRLLNIVGIKEFKALLATLIRSYLPKMDLKESLKAVLELSHLKLQLFRFVPNPI
ncbi:MAG: transposase, partial [Nitrosopumilus sp.]